MQDHRFTSSKNYPFFTLIYFPRISQQQNCIGTEWRKKTPITGLHWGVLNKNWSTTIPGILWIIHHCIKYSGWAWAYICPCMMNTTGFNSEVAFFTPDIAWIFYQLYYVFGHFGLNRVFGRPICLLMKYSNKSREKRVTFGFSTLCIQNAWILWLNSL